MTSLLFIATLSVLNANTAHISGLTTTTTGDGSQTGSDQISLFLNSTLTTNSGRKILINISEYKIFDRDIY